MLSSSDPRHRLPATGCLLLWLRDWTVPSVQVRIIELRLSVLEPCAAVIEAAHIRSRHFCKAIHDPTTLSEAFRLGAPTAFGEDTLSGLRCYRARNGPEYPRSVVLFLCRIGLPQNRANVHACLSTSIFGQPPKSKAQRLLPSESTCAKRGHSFFHMGG